MLKDLGGVTGTLLVKALDVAALRHSVIANNIANAETEGFRPSRVEFESLLQSALGSETYANDGDRRASKAISTAPQIVVESSSENDGPTSLIQREMVALAKNTLRYQALVTALSRRGDWIGIAIKGGRA